MKEFILTESATNRAYLVGVISQGQSDAMMQEYLDELEFLAHTAQIQTVRTFTQRLEMPNSVTYVGKGKLEEIASMVEEDEVGLVIFDDELSPSSCAILRQHLRSLSWIVLA